ncbi:MAG: hypothetical protein QOK48_3191 [Blastocatellia bacterium]|jgi:hypothetical protein|nr:hypothetical protein [Blastocatellia bacterium]
MKESEPITSFCRADDWKRFVQYLRHTNRFALTDYWNEFLRLLIDTAQKRRTTIARGSEFFRARQGIASVEEEFGGERPAPYSRVEMGPPPSRLAKEGRLNPAGIPYLYLASDIETTIAEVRPWIGLEISVGRFETLRELRTVDTRHDKPNELVLVAGEDFDFKERDPMTYSAEEKEQQIWGDINSAFSEPTSPHDSHLSYLPTQYLTELLKVNRYDGVIYKS